MIFLYSDNHFISEPSHIKIWEHSIFFKLLNKNRFNWTLKIRVFIDNRLITNSIKCAIAVYTVNIKLYPLAKMYLFGKSVTVCHGHKPVIQLDRILFREPLTLASAKIVLSKLVRRSLFTVK